MSFIFFASEQVKCFMIKLDANFDSLSEFMFSFNKSNYSVTVKVK